ncbi:MAG: tail fiber domain-containing protein [Candidatus Gastranaerophilaceae bacterium]
MIQKYRKGFTLAETLITLVIISLVMAATMPVVVKSQNSPSEAPWKYVTQGDLSQNAAVFTALGETSSGVFGDKRVPIDSNIAAANKDTIYATRLNPRISIVTRNRASGPVIGRHLIDFYEKEGTGNYTSIGKVSFDRYYNLALGQNALDAIKADAGSEQKATVNGSGDSWNELLRTGTGDINTAEIRGAANTAVGQYSMAGGPRYTSANSSDYNITGVGNTALGAFSLRKVTSGNVNTGIGLYSLHVAGSSNYNTAVGGYTLKLNTTGEQNNVLGAFAMESNTSGRENLAIGTRTLQQNTTGNNNIAIGNSAMMSNKTGSNNIVIGKYGFQGNESGNGNIIIGNNVGIGNSENKLYIGGCSEGGAYSNNGTDTLIYGDLKEGELFLNTNNITLGMSDDSRTFLKGEAYILTDGGANWHKVATVDDIENMIYSLDLMTGMVGYTGPFYSDARLKNILGDNKAGLKEIMQIQVKNYTMKRDKKKEVIVGVIAQELQKVFPNSVSEGRDGYLRIKRDEIFYACVNAIKELNNKIQDIVAKITGLEEKIRILEDTNKVNANKIAELERQNKLFEERLAALEGSASKKSAAVNKKVKEADVAESEVEKNVTKTNKTEKK